MRKTDFKIFRYSFLLFCAAVLLFSCQKAHEKENYSPILKELFNIECDQLKIEGINFTINDTNIYTFRGIAFDKIMTRKPNAVLIAHYEDLNQKLAAMEYYMDEQDKKNYYDNIKEIYLQQCR